MGTSIDQETYLRLRDEVWPALEEGFGIPSGILHAIAWWETRGKFDLATSPKGARGLFQIMPIAEEQVKQSFGFQGDIMNPYIASMYAAALISRLNKRFFGHIPLILAAYNAGEGNVARFIREVRNTGQGFLPLETLNYIQGVRGFMGW